MHHSEWGYHRDEESGNCILDPKCGPELDCLTGYVCYVFNINVVSVLSPYHSSDQFH